MTRAKDILEARKKMEEMSIKESICNECGKGFIQCGPGGFEQGPPTLSDCNEHFIPGIDDVQNNRG